MFKNRRRLQFPPSIQTDCSVVSFFLNCLVNVLKYLKNLYLVQAAAQKKSNWEVALIGHLVEK